MFAHSCPHGAKQPHDGRCQGLLRSPTVDPHSETLTAEAIAAVANTMMGTSEFEDAATHVHRLHKTMTPEQFVGLSGARRAFAKMSELATDPGTRFAVTRVIGEGGMGVVHLAEQRSLGRKVVLKSLREQAQSEENTLRLLQEAWVTGWLEHPNVVPVHDVTLDSEGRPLIVLKRIEGETWSDLMGDAEAVRKHFGEDDLLEWNLRLYMQVCNAVHFAHSRGILHRDLKPDNVMIGTFGEVYVVDWGIAVSLHDDAEGRLPAAQGITGVAGTPCYMAPEMLTGDGADLSEATDVYLLGAILHEILTGQAPHRGETLPEVLQSVSLGPPPPDGPAPLVDLCRRAMANEPQKRPPSAEALRLEVQTYLRQRSVGDLIVQAQKKLERLLVEVHKAPADATASQDIRRHRLALYELFSACKFGFQEALRVWPDGQLQREGLATATTAMIEYELDRGSPEQVMPLLAELSQVAEPTPELLAQIEQASAKLAQQQAHIQQLAQMGRQLDPTVGQRTRTFITLCLGTLFTLVPLSGRFVHARFDEEAMRHGLTAMAGLLLVIVAGFGYWARESMMKTAINRRVMATAAVAIIVQILLLLSLPGLGLALATAEILMLLLWALVGAMLAIGVATAMFPSAIGYLVGFFIAVQYPAWRYEMMSATNLVLTINLVWISVPADFFFWQLRRTEKPPGD